ncbi:CoA ester lyase [Streptomyces sp. TM32]|uniref:HpcH/HpaI aldolase/citrate lyase family protein n=1 Tax=Streptomyces sp. TM32 TaxID=1652669 RepID=UPI00101134FD|nr:CoA ester lyase [Streptomyces sp. TM32]RXS88393.1 CoA ester lyase [Streptomyces sp. TM32]
MPGLLRSYLYVPAHQPHRIDKAYASCADAVVLDLEDAVPPEAKDAARESAASVVASATGKPTFVRVNGLATGRAAEDIAAVAGPGLAGIRLPKAEHAEEVRRVAGWLSEANCPAPVHLLLESALGVENAFELARACDAAGGISLGEADLAADLGALHEVTLDVARARCVIAARAAGLPGPVQSVFTAVDDLGGLRRSCLRGKRQGFFGRSAVHPKQLDLINESYSPTDREIADAAALVDVLGAALADDCGAALTTDGRFVDAATVRSAHQILALADHARKEKP